MNYSEKDHFIQQIRQIARKEGLNPVTLEKLKELPSVSNELLNKYIKNNKELARLILENEKKQMEQVLSIYEKDDDNAIDLLFRASRDIADKFHSLSPVLTNQYKELYPELYKEFFDYKASYVFDKIFFNIQRGIWQGLYRDDVSTELVARRYISRLIDLHNPDNFPPEEFSFSTVFIEMFENFVKSIATEKGLQYWEERKTKSGITGV